MDIEHLRNTFKMIIRNNDEHMEVYDADDIAFDPHWDIG